MYRKPHPAMISVMAGEIPCSCTSQRRHARTGIILAAVNVIGHSLALCLRGIAANVAKLLRPFEESLLPTFPFVVGCGLVAETVDFPARQFGRRHRPPQRYQRLHVRGSQDIAPQICNSISGWILK
jgi:hypothetical protein